jgi:hypothetical protein
MFGKEDVITGVRIERRIEVNEIDGFVGDVPPEHVEIVPVVEQVRRVPSHGLRG